MNDNRSIYSLDLDEHRDLLISWGERPFRATQLWKGIYQGLAHSPGEISTIPIPLREKLGAHFSDPPLTPVVIQESSDGETSKVLFELQDGKKIETVLMNYDKRHTLCISSQVGCALNCSFCATGQMGFSRNLTTGEIVEQVIYFARQLSTDGKAVTNIVFMGMGEPFHNYDAVMKAIRILNHPDGLGLGARRFTISTAGLVPGILRFAEESSQINLAISLHATEDQYRSQIMPINKKYPISEVLSACKTYFERTHRRITFEWALIAGLNDSEEQAIELANLLKGLTCHVNVIPLNPTKGFEGEKSSSDKVIAFQKILQSRGVPCTIRIRRGIDIQAGCGQLASENQ